MSYNKLIICSLILIFLQKVKLLMHGQSILNETIRSIPVDSGISSLSRSINKGGKIKIPNIQYENYKALIGETVRLECPQHNPTWFYRHSNINSKESSEKDDMEDLIVTRHGIINADYKFKIMCHMTLKHKIIIINNIDFEEEGLYTCLYTLPTESSAESLKKSSSILSLSSISSAFSEVNNDHSISYNTIDDNKDSFQYRYVFNVTVYSLINGLTMNIKPIMIKTTPLNMIRTNNININKNKDVNQQYELIENSLTIKENDEFLINCIVESSKPAANIKLTVSFADENNDKNSNLINHNFSSKSSIFSSDSILSQSSNIIKNFDRTFKTIHSSRMKANAKDHGKILTCESDNGFSNQKWENKKLLNILFPPICKDPHRFIYYAGINQTSNIECRIANANPSRITYKWNFENFELRGYNSFEDKLDNENILNEVDINSLQSITENTYISKDSNLFINGNGNDIFPNSYDSIGGSTGSLINSKGKQNKNYNTKISNLMNEGLTSRFQWRPISFNDFGEVRCIATNDIGSTECIYEIKLGGVPNPPTDCNYVMKNTSAIISCLVGYHQGDPDIYCYLLRKSDNGVYKEHTRNRESCSFIVNDVNVNKLNEFWVYSSNKHGHNKDSGVYLTIGQFVKSSEIKSGQSFYVFVAISAGIILILLLCCLCLKIRKGFSDDNESCDGDIYNQRSSNGKRNPNESINQNSYPNKMIKGIKAEKVLSFDYNDNINEKKYVKLEFESNKSSFFNEMDNNMYASANEKSKNEIYNQLIIKSNSHPEKINASSNEEKLADCNYMSAKYLFKNTKTSDQNSLKAKEFEDTNSSFEIVSQLNDLNHRKSIRKLNSNYENNPFSKSKNNPNIEENDKFNENVEAFENQNIKLSSSSSSSSSLSSLSSLLMQKNKMITFSNNLHSKCNKSNKIKQKNSHSNTTTIASTTSSNTSSTSPVVSSFNTNEESSNSYSTIENIEYNDNEDVKLRNQKADNKMISNQTISQQNTRNINSNNRNSNIIISEMMIEKKFLNKLCEEIEVSLNVDCECADDYSSNDFSGDYSFDTEPSFKYPINSSNTNFKKTSNNNLCDINNVEQNDKNVNITKFTELRKEVEKNVKNQQRNNLNKYNGPSRNHEKISNNHNEKQISTNTPFGVLV